MINNPLKRGPWKLTDLKSVKPLGLNVFSCFSSGGGSTMGYKLTGYAVLGGVEIDPKMAAIYKTNHNPKYMFQIGVQEFKNVELPHDTKLELDNLDVLDGSPPCSSFSMAGSREKAWGKEKKFREGQANQILDDLFFEFIAVANKLRPKIVIAENVKGLISGNARGYVKQIFSELNKIGYTTQLFLLNAATMGVPQQRERVFFIARRNDLKLRPISLVFEEPSVSIDQAMGEDSAIGKALNPETIGYKIWSKVMPGDNYGKVLNGSNFSQRKFNKNNPALTITAAGGNFHWDTPATVNDLFYKRIQTFPDDYDFGDQTAQYVCGMSVPPFMMQRIATEIYKQMLIAPSRAAKV